MYEWFFLILTISTSQAQQQVTVDAKQQMSLLLKTSDTDRDRKITVLDRNTIFWLEDNEKKKREVSGAYHLSNLLQELKLASDAGKNQILAERIFENPVTRISRSIRELYWDGLTRRVDAENLAQALPDSKLPKSEWRYVYVPAADTMAVDYFTKAASATPSLKIKVVPLEKGKEISSNHGLLTLALEKDKEGRIRGVPFVVPGGRFNEMYGWDSYFEALGLIVDERRDLARAMVNNFVYQIENYGKILNANRSYYLNRSQPPFLTSMISAVYASGGESKPWLEKSLRAAMKEYFEVWMNPDRLTETGLSRYFGSGKSIPPEVEKGHFDYILKPAARKHKVSVAELTRRYNAGLLEDPELDEFFSQDRAVRESGHDTTYRWRVDGKDRAADFVTVDLNSLLYKFEVDFARFIQREFNDQFSYEGRKMTSAEWRERAEKRKAAMLKFLWDPERQIFFDYNFKRGQRSEYISATAFYPLWAGEILDKNAGQASIAALLKELEEPGGIASTARTSLEQVGRGQHLRQWDHPNGWAPHQMIAWEAIKNYGQVQTADRLIYKWIYTITRNAANFNGTVPEKTDVVLRSHRVFAEYGNVGTEFSYITKEGFGWMNASYQVGLKLLTPKWRKDLEDLRPPEWIEFK